MNNGSETAQRVAVAIIGDEVLLGEVAEGNLRLLACGIARAGADLAYAAVLPDRMDFLVGHLRWMTDAFDLVIATGGIGPTHDDLTRQAAAAVFGLPLAEHPEAVRAMEKGCGVPLREKTREMALLPAGSSLIPNPVTHAPGFTVENLVVLPGIPELVRAMVPALQPLLAGKPVLREEILTTRTESEIAAAFGALAREFPQVKMGSYPALHRDGHRVRLVLRSRDAGSLARAAARVKEIAL
jgi:molybdenum cofactor synthesis domain-containing protein